MMIARFFKPAAAFAVIAVLLGFFLFGANFFSYVRTSGRAVQRAAQQSVSVEFELQRARDMVDQILPQLQANVRLIAEEEVEIAELEQDIAASREKLAKQQDKLAALRSQMEVRQVSYRVDGRDLTREHIAQNLSQQFSRYREAELILDSKEQLLQTRRRSLQNALQMHDRAKHQKLQLEQKIESLVAQHRLVKTSSIGSKVAVEGGQLNRAEQLLGQIQRRLDVSQRILAHEADLHEIQLDADQVDESELLAEFDEYFTKSEGGQLVTRQ
ncbi:MAG: signal peptide-containing protein [Pirellulales bacterium]|nr:signal peptide-containing protein [Pirellulales bacterium]